MLEGRDGDIDAVVIDEVEVETHSALTLFCARVRRRIQGGQMLAGPYLRSLR